MAALFKIEAFIREALSEIYGDCRALIFLLEPNNGGRKAVWVSFTVIKGPRLVHIIFYLPHFL
jgi:hypothetical protein